MAEGFSWLARLRALFGRPATPWVEVTPRAAARVREITRETGIKGKWCLRLEASWPEWAPLPQHKMEFDDDPPPRGYVVHRSRGLKVALLLRQAAMLQGSQIDFGDRGDETGFIITSPNLRHPALEKWETALRADALSKSQ